MKVKVIDEGQGHEIEGKGHTSKSRSNVSEETCKELIKSRIVAKKNFASESRS